MGPKLVLCLVLIGLTLNVGHVFGISVMSIDLGAEWMKIGIVSPGVPMEIVLNKESKRKTPVAVSFRNGERLFGDDALNVGVRFPAMCYTHFLDLLGKNFDNPAVKLFQKRFPYHTLVPDESRGTVLFKYDSDTFYSPEELLGMIFSKAREFAQDSSRQPVKEAVITVPPYFNQAERRAVLNAADLADIKVLQLMNSNTAAALNYGIFRRKDFNETAQYILLYDMGAHSTVATVISYQTVKTKERSVVETNPQLSILGVGYDRTLGGLEMQIRLRNYLAQTFNEMKKTKTDVFTNHRSMAKLFKEAGRVKNVLSANADHFAQVEGLLDEQDFRTQVTRDHFEELCADLFDRVEAPVKQALDAAGISLEIIDQVILVGAGTRVPKVQERLQALVKGDLGKSLNTDEAAALGAVYKAADLSSGFKVKKFITKDAVIFPIIVDFERWAENDDGSKTLKMNRRFLYSYMNPYPQKKILTFNKHVDDFTFYVNYGDLHVSDEETKTLGSLNITKVDLSGVIPALSKHSQEGESKGIKAHFNLDESGILSISTVEAVFEKNSTEEAATMGDTLSKLGSAFSSLFSGSTDDGTKPAADSNEGDENKSDEESKTSTEKPANKTDTESQNSSKSGNVTENTNSTSPDKGKVKTVVIKEPITMDIHILDIPKLEGDTFQASAKKLSTLNEQDKIRAQTEKARNALETFVIDMQNNMYSDEYERAVKEEEKETILQQCSETSDWLYEDGSDAEKTAYEEKLKALKLLTKDLKDRVREHKERPDALEALEKMLNISMGFLDSSKVLPEDQQLFTETELNTLEKLVTETVTWREKKVKEQEELPLSDPPILTVRLIHEKIDSLDREVKYMINKARVNKLNKMKEEAKAKESENKTDDIKGEEKSDFQDTETPAATEEDKTEPSNSTEKVEGHEDSKSETDSQSEDPHTEL